MLNIALSHRAGQSSGGSIDSSGSLLSLFQNLNSIGGGLGGAFSGAGAGAGAGSVVIYPGQGSSAYSGYNGYSGYTGYSSATVSPGGCLVELQMKVKRMYAKISHLNACLA